jgi:hypothetical protein
MGVVWGCGAVFAELAISFSKWGGCYKGGEPPAGDKKLANP